MARSAAWGATEVFGEALLNPSASTNVVMWDMIDYPFGMPRLSIDISPEDHQKLKAIAALKGQSIKDYVLGRALGDAPALDGKSEDQAFMALANFLEPRIEQARRGQLSGKSLDEIRREERSRAGV
ncbi:hypothetical protein GCM10011363_28680 [Marivita lacus]|uniref:Antitoxin n=1 Tax=Marivita lacus TaxID=1323742 RepID=A0ABQ1KYF9_9RHOB|nr:hypothetical protein [Marivita lacus]GGC10281.1 hypothetical protein GCM10011363_28680 [Marivita lacus]